MIDVVYLARFRELLGSSGESLAWDSNWHQVNDLVAHLVTRGDQWQELFDGKQRVMIAVNQDMVRSDHPLRDGDEVAFFPPVTGG